MVRAFPQQSGILTVFTMTMACGARTGLLSDEQRAVGSAAGSPTVVSADGGAVFCALHAGPMTSCDAGVDAGGVVQCDTDFPICAMEFDGPELGWWGCCRIGTPKSCIYNIHNSPCPE